MKHLFRPFLTLVAIAATAGLALAGDAAVIVGFKSGVDAAVVKKHGGAPGLEIRGLRALAVRIPASAIASLRADPSVAYVEEDGIVEISRPGNGGGGGGGKPAPTQPPQSTPWGVARVGAPLAGSTGAGVKVAVIDTGIDLDHPDLADNVNPGANFVKNGDPDDDNGHGSHVAGTIGALNNTIGVVGVAPDASLFPVKVLDRRGSGQVSAVAAGIDWARANGMHVANMSLGSSSSFATIENACNAASSAGVLLIAAAGNSGDGNTATTEIGYPAAYGSVVATGATSSTDAIASFSNTGPYLELSAPGVSVDSTYKGAGYKTLNGTSMASPHAAGVAALIWGDLASPSASTVRSALQARARDLGPAGRDNGYGYGIVLY